MSDANRAFVRAAIESDDPLDRARFDDGDPHGRMAEDGEADDEGDIRRRRAAEPIWACRD